MRFAVKAVSIASLALACGAAASWAQDGVPSAPPAGGAYALDPTHASLIWKVSHMGMSKYVARFTKFDARLVLDPANPAASSVTATIDPRSVETDYPVGKRDFNKELAEQPTWFNAAKFPKIEFVSKSVRIVGKNRAQVLGDLTLLGVKKPVRLDVVLNRAINPHPLTKVPAVGFSAKGKLLRSDFGMAHLIPLGVGDEVEIEIEAEFSQTSAG